MYDEEREGEQAWAADQAAQWEASARAEAEYHAAMQDEQARAEAEEPPTDPPPNLERSDKDPAWSRFRWNEFLTERARMIRYFREVDGKSWEQIARTLSCDPVQVELIYGGDCGRD